MSHSRHRFSLYTLPDHFWRWRMKGSAAELIEQSDDLADFDLIFVTSLCNIADLKALIGPTCPPVVLYAHENQLTYPKSPSQRQDFHALWIDFINTAVADCVLYNSDFHRNSYHRALELFIGEIPRTTLNPEYWIRRVQERAFTLYPGTDTPLHLPVRTHTGDTPRILWNHRWEHDKQPALFLETLIRCMEAGYNFEVILLGESPAEHPPACQPLIDRLRDRIFHAGYVDTRADYFSLLAEGDIVISTAIQENFGLSIVEAVQCGCFPLLPERLSYPELIPETHRQQVLYKTDRELYGRLTDTLDQGLYREKTLTEMFSAHRWKNRIADYDNLLSAQRP